MGMKLRILAVITTLMIGAGFSLISCSGKNPTAPLAVATPAAPKVNGGVVSTLAGNGSFGIVNGAVTVAEFEYPYGVAVDNSGNVYVSDNSGGDIRKISNGSVTTFATGFSSPWGLSVDAGGNVYVADESHYQIKKITPAGVVSVLAGNGTSGEVDGPGASAEFKSPSGVAVDASGNVYVSDEYGYTIRKITQSGGVSVTTLAGVANTSGYVDGAGTTAEFYYPYGLAVDSLGNVFVADEDNNVIRKITPAGVVSTFTSSYYPNAIAIDSSNNVYVADDHNNIIEYSPTGVETDLAGSGVSGSTNGTGVNAMFDYPLGLAVDASGVVYVSDSDNDLIRKIQ